MLLDYFYPINPIIDLVEILDASEFEELKNASVGPLDAARTGSLLLMIVAFPLQSPGLIGCTSLVLSIIITSPFPLPFKSIPSLKSLYFDS